MGQEHLTTFRAEANIWAVDSMNVQTLAGCIESIGWQVAVVLEKLLTECLGQLGSWLDVCHRQLADGRCDISIRHNAQIDGHFMQC